MDPIDSSRQALVERLVALYRRFPQVEALALAGSLTSGASTDPASDIDLCVYINAPIPLEERLALVEQLGGAARASMGLDYWGPGDEWFDAASGIEVDAVYWETGWMEETLKNILERCQASLGYTTAFWHTVRSSRSLYDRSGWFARLQAWCARPYPEALRQAIIVRNSAVLREIIPAYAHQVEKAARRGDLVSVNHRVAALLASYFDVIFAYNRVPHPGEKRLLEQAARMCPRLPRDMASQVNALLHSAGAGDEHLVGAIHDLLDGLDELLKSAG
jgi:hypothetical protein